MRRESSTVVALVGEISDGLLAELGRAMNVSVARAPAPESGADSGQLAGQADLAGWRAGALAMREAGRRHSTYVIVPDDPLAAVATGWRAMWDVTGGPDGAAQFERGALDTLAAWKTKQFELPDYYLVLAPILAETQIPDLFLGPLRAARPRRVAVAATGAGSADAQAQATLVTGILGALEYGPWWPPLDELLDSARRYFPGQLPE